MAIPFLSPVTTTADIRLPSNGKLFLWTGHDLNFLRYNLWQASASAGMTIKNLASSGSIIFQTNSTTALTLDSSQNATFAGDIYTKNLKLGNGSTDSSIQLDGDFGGGDLTIQNLGNNQDILFKGNDNGTAITALTLDMSDAGAAIFTGKIVPNAHIELPYGVELRTLDSGGTVRTIARASSNKLQYGWSYAGEVEFMGGGSYTPRITINTNGSTTFAGDVTIGALTSGETAQLTVNNEGGVPSVARFKSRTNKAHIEISDNDTTGYISSENGLFSIGRNAGVNAAHININASNQVLIGASTTSFNDKLYLSGDAYINGSLRIGTSATYIGKMFNSSGVLTIQSDGDRDIQIGSSNNVDVIAIDTSAQSTTFAGNIAIGSGTTGSAYDSSTLIHTKGGSRSVIQQSSTADAYYMFGDAAANNAAWIGYLHNTGTLQLQAQTNVTINKNTAVTGNISATGSITANAFSGDGSSLTGIAQANNLQSFDDRDIAPEDLSFSDDLKLFFAEKTGIEGGTVGSDYQDLLILSSYVDSSGGKLNALALDKSTHRILHYNANHNATNWGTAKELAYTSDFVKRTGGSSTSMSGDLHIIAGAPKIYLQDNTDDDDQQIVFRNNAGVDDYKITTQDFTGSGAGDGMFIGSENADQVALVTNDTIALTIDTSQNVTFAGSITGKDNGIIIDSLSGPFGRIHGTSSIFLGGGSTTQVQLSGNIMPDGNNSRSLGTSSRYWSETFTSGVTSGGNIVINSNTPILTLGVINSSTGNAKIQFYSKNSGTSNGYAVQYNKDTGIDRLEFIDGSGTANIKFNNGGAAEFAGSVTATQINTGQGATEVHLMNQNLRTTDDVTFDDLTVTGNFTVTGTVNTVSSTNLVVQDKTITVGKNQTESASGGSGLIVDGSSASILWDETNDTWDFNKGIDVDGNINVGTQATDILIGDNLGAALEVKEGSNLYIRFNTTNANEKIEINKPVEATFINASTGFRMASGQAIDFISTNIGYNSIERNTTVGGLQINTGDSASMNILDDGKVGIGTSTPGQKLEVAGRIRVTTDPTIEFYEASNKRGGIQWDITNDYTNIFAVGGDIRFDAGGEKMRITSAGNVGIGTNSPGALLHLANTSGGPIYLEDTDATDTFDITSISNGGGNLSFDTRRSSDGAFVSTDYQIVKGASGADYQRWFTAGSERLRITSNGNVGIGETSPSHKITVPSGTNGRVARLGNLEITTQSGTYTGSSIEVTGSNSFITYKSTLGHKFVTRTSGGGNTLEALTIVPDTGNIGIGSTSPGAILEISDATNDNLRIGTRGGNINIFSLNDAGATAPLRLEASQFDFINGDVTFAGKIIAGKGVNYTGGTIAQATTVLHTNNIVYNIGGSNGIILSNADYSDRYYITNADHRWEVGSADAMRLNSTGLGIGTTSPAYKLDVAGDIKCTTSLKIDAGSPFLGLYNSGTEKAYLQWSQSNDYLTLQSDGDTRFITVGTERIRIKSDGKVGIGTTAPTYKLSVPSGGIEAGGKITYSKSAGSLNATGYAVAGITANASGNGSSCGFVFTCFGHVGAYQRIVYSCYNSSGTWYAKKVIDEGTNQLDVVASANGSTITFTFKATDSTMSYTPRVTVEATGHNINSTYA